MIVCASMGTNGFQEPAVGYESGPAGQGSQRNAA